MLAFILYLLLIEIGVIPRQKVQVSCENTIVWSTQCVKIQVDSTNLSIYFIEGKNLHDMVCLRYSNKNKKAANRKYECVNKKIKLIKKNYCNSANDCCIFHQWHVVCTFEAKNDITLSKRKVLKWHATLGFSMDNKIYITA